MPLAPLPIYNSIFSFHVFCIHPEINLFRNTQNMNMKAHVLPPLPLFLCALSFSSILPPPSLSERCHPHDKKVLLQIKKALNNPFHLASWNPDVDCCDWEWIACDLATNRVISLQIYEAEISAQIPAQLGDLPFLETLDFYKISNLTGTIPSSIAKLKNLRIARFSSANLSGPVPAFFSQLKNVVYLDLSLNSLNGHIPSSLSSLPGLAVLHLEGNKLMGPIPDSFGHFPIVGTEVYLNDNQLSGKIPASLGNMDFNALNVARNKLEGDASMLFGLNKTGHIMNLSWNMLEFDLSKVEFAKSLMILELNHNNITGSIPPGITSLDHLMTFNVSYNSLCGQIPVGGNLQRFSYSVYFHNRCLCGAPLLKCK